MAGCCHDGHCATVPPQDDVRWRRVLWGALVLNAGMFLAEIVAGVTAGSVSLQADALDFLGDAANYSISLGVVGLSLGWRARAALFKGLTILAMGLWVAGNTAWHALHGTLPAAGIMGMVGVVAMLANTGVGLALYRFRGGDANRRAAWICARNDVIGNAAVLLAAAGVFGTGTGWPDIVVATVMACLGIGGGLQILRHAREDLRTSRESAWPVRVWSQGADRRSVRPAP